MGNAHVHVNNDVEKLRIEVTSMKDTIHELNVEKESAEQRIADLERKVSDLERNLDEIRLEKESADKENDDETELESEFSSLHMNEGNSVDINNPVASISNAHSEASFDVLDDFNTPSTSKDVQIP